MTSETTTMPYWELEFSADGFLVGAPAVFDELAGREVTDLMVMSHGWNNSSATARSLYRAFFALLGKVADDAGLADGRRVGTVGVLWPSMRWADEAPPQADGEGALLSAGTPPTDAELVEQLTAVYEKPEQRAAIDILAALLSEQPASDEALHAFRAQMNVLADAGDGGPVEDRGEAGIFEVQDARTLFDHFAALDTRPAPDDGSMLAFGGFGKLWRGAREALRAVTYWEMKRRAGVVGRVGLAPALMRLQESLPTLRFHLVGHSFGARLVAFTLAGLPDGVTGSASPVKSLILLQGAFSHFAFASKLPHDAQRAGALDGMAARVDGPLLATFTDLDTAVGYAYPMASIFSRDDSAAFENQLYRWGGLGFDGFQAVDAQALPLAPVGAPYHFEAGGFVNLDSNAVIRTGGPPAGSHNDIVQPEVVWATLSAAGLVTGG